MRRFSSALIGLAIASIAWTSPLHAIPLQTRVQVTASGTVQVENTDGAHCPTPPVYRLLFDANSPSELFGTWRSSGMNSEFTPGFPLLSGHDYIVQVSCDDRVLATLPLHTPKTSREHPVQVLRIAPAAHELPSNLLRVYVMFDGDMRGVFSRDDVSLTDQKGRRVRGAFMNFGPELWSPDGHRLTLLFDPGRIKRGVTANEEEGPVFRLHERYRLKVHLPTGTRTLASSAESTFSIESASRRPLNEKAWQISTPAFGTKEPLDIAFDRVMDEGTVNDGVTIVDVAGHTVPGAGQVTSDGKRFRFRPSAAWATPHIEIHIASTVEDVSGNCLSEALDHTVGKDQEGCVSAQVEISLVSPHTLHAQLP